MKSRQIFVFILFLLLGLSGCKNVPNDQVLSEYEPLDYDGIGRVMIRIPGPYIFDTVYFENGVAIYEQDKYENEIGWLYALDVDKNMVHYLILEKGTITITTTKDSLIFFTGTPNNDLLFTLDKEIEPLRMKMKVMGREVKKLRLNEKNEEADKLQNQILEISKIWWGKQKEFALTNINMAGLNYVTKLVSRFSTTELKQILDDYHDFSGTTAYQKVEKRYNAEIRTDVGVAAPTFSLVNDNGEVVTLASLQDKLTIIDFWASWCKPCRAENPNLIALYDEWKAKGLEIVSVSIDKKEDKDKWLSAIEEDELTWPQLWDLESKVKEAYGITSVPRTFLVDENGIIVAKGLRGENLNEFVKHYLN